MEVLTSFRSSSSSNCERKYGIEEREAIARSDVIVLSMVVDCNQKYLSADALYGSMAHPPPRCPSPLHFPPTLLYITSIESNSFIFHECVIASRNFACCVCVADVTQSSLHARAFVAQADDDDVSRLRHTFSVPKHSLHELYMTCLLHGNMILISNFCY